VSVEVRRVRAEEWEAFRSVRLAALLDAPSAFSSTYALESASPDEEWERRAAVGADGAERTLFLAWRGVDPVGVVGGGRLDEDHAELVSMWVAPEARRGGVARRLVTALLGWAAASGRHHVQLWVTQGNEPAQRFYESMGFSVIDGHQALASDPCKDEIRMARSVAASAD
jgi:ribosomal protein S18 acetylase RimI-like enzyme